MTETELQEDVRDELALMQEVVRELVSLRRDVEGDKPTRREKVAAGAFLAQFYNGVENVLKRISKFEGVPPPIGEKWHAELFNRFTEPPAQGLPLLFDKALADEMRAYRGFRHVARISYGIDLDWERMKQGIGRIKTVFDRFHRAVLRYIDSLKNA